MLELPLNQSIKYTRKSWIKTNHESTGINNANSQNKFSTLILRSRLYDYGETYVLLSITITVLNTRTVTNPNNKTKAIIKNCSPCTNYISEIDNTTMDNAKELNMGMPRCNLIEYSNKYTKTFPSLWQYCRHQPFINGNRTVAGFPADKNGSGLFKFKTKIAGRIGNDGTRNVKTRVPLKCLSNFWKILKFD